VLSIHFVPSDSVASSNCVDEIGADIGSQFFSLAHSEEDGTVETLTNPVTNSVICPSAVAVKFIQPQSLPLSPRDFVDIEVYVGPKALSLLRHTASLGFEDLLRTIGRFGPSEFTTATVASGLELFAMMLVNAFRIAPPFHAVAVSLCSCWTRNQLFAITDAYKAFEIPLVAADAEVDAVAPSMSARFSKAHHHVLFVDVGAVSTKVYSALFAGSNPFPTRDLVEANQTSTEWSESIGGHYFAKAPAAAKTISIRRAQRSLIRKAGDGLASLESLVRPP
jgi:hypothetical protein